MKNRGIIGTIISIIIMLILIAAVLFPLFFFTEILKRKGAIKPKTLYISANLTLKTYKNWYLTRLLNAPVYTYYYYYSVGQETSEGVDQHKKILRYIDKRTVNLLEIFYMAARDDEVGEAAREYLMKDIGYEITNGGIYRSFGLLNLSINGILIKNLSSGYTFSWKYNESEPHFDIVVDDVFISINPRVVNKIET